MLTAIDIHYLIGLLTSVTSPNDVEIILGDKIYDEASDKKRDVDITINYLNGESTIFKGLEVKNHARPLQVEHVEQLCIIS